MEMFGNILDSTHNVILNYLWNHVEFKTSFGNLEIILNSNVIWGNFNPECKGMSRNHKKFK